ncbi:CNT family concentrative nucleoside transporter [Solibacillus kalamii]|uniref:Nucleoside permease n=1 Tax=Solibacillus kalamii TaxID=1748298 RepID=A0ABX3ZJH5_9BACL|nr:NupC/NupG family nucleoside CNT transporter [Solibacillus kalamii]MBM7664392.1 CNT family concentrative nucleoside transporter [Solibacillus kalamii]OUZ39848.1 NupC/NupG family nucleoside CNT transporter [Solibacillus kalamii]
MDFVWGIIGILGIVAIAIGLSNNRKAIQWRIIISGLIVQLIFAFIVLKWSFGREKLMQLSEGVQKLVSYANEGIVFVFGGLADPDNVGFVFAMSVLTIIIFFSSLISVLYYLGIMQFVIKIIGGFLSKVLGTTKAESVNAAANIFVGQTEAPLVIRPFLNKMTRSQMFAVMTGGLASVSGSVLIGYSLLGVPLEYLLAASFMAAPAGLVMAKLMIPETEEVNEDDFKLERNSEATNVIDAAAVGASDGLKLAVNVGAMLLSFIALIALLNGILGGITGLFGFENVTLEGLLGYVFAPLAFLIGVPWDEAVRAGSFIGQKLILNEFVAYSNFGPVIGELSDKTAIIISFALCGFANLSSMGILIGGLGGMAPDKRPMIAQLAIKAVAAGTLASLLSAAIAGMFI